jgi:hypothetical protein
MISTDFNLLIVLHSYGEESCLISHIDTFVFFFKKNNKNEKRDRQKEVYIL